MRFFTGIDAWKCADRKHPCTCWKELCRKWKESDIPSVFFYLQLVSFIYDSIPGSLSNHTVDIEVI